MTNSNSIRQDDLSTYIYWCLKKANIKQDQWKFWEEIDAIPNILLDLVKHLKGYLQQEDQEVIGWATLWLQRKENIQSAPYMCDYIK